MKIFLILFTGLIITNVSYSQNNDVIVDEIYSESIQKLSANTSGLASNSAVRILPPLRRKTVSDTA